MIRITDRTLSCLDEFQNISSEHAEMFLRFLIQTGVDTIEISEAVFTRLPSLPEFPSYILRLTHHPADAENYPFFHQFVCRNAKLAASGCTAEIQLNDMRDVYTITSYAKHEKVRLCGLDNFLLGNYQRNFAQLKSAFKVVEFCPSNSSYCAAALAAEWVAGGYGNEIVTSFAGIGGFAPTEEMIMILRRNLSRKVGKTYEFFPEMVALFEEMTGPLSATKPVLGREIFHVESGIHVDGILKQPKCYEPFPPEVVGLSRKIILGKHSGSSSVRVKLDELGLTCPHEKIPLILERVKKLGTEKGKAVTDSEFARIASDFA